MSTSGKYRTDLCEDIGASHIGKEVMVSGWVHRRRDHGGVIFIDLRDVSGILQLVFDPENQDLFATAEKIRSEFVLSVTGIVRERPQGTINDQMKTGEVELLVEKGEVLNTSETPPFHHDEATNEDIRLKYRYLDLRRENMSNNIKVRHEITKSLREYLNNASYFEIETPILELDTTEQDIEGTYREAIAWLNRDFTSEALAERAKKAIDWIKNGKPSSADYCD